MNTFSARLVLLTAAAMAIAVLWQTLPLIQASFWPWRGEPRLVAARGSLADEELATIALFEATKESVVSITTAGRVIDPWTRSAQEVPRGTGTGFVWDGLGHLVTNHHVVEGASRALVRLADGRTFEASLVGSDPSHDLAVLRIAAAASRPEPLAIGSSGDLAVGQRVFAIGNPYGLDWTLTSGIVSALDRDLPDARGGAIRGLIQTDAAINPGNSGGPLIDSAGRMIGVNTAIYSPSGASAGIGFAVPVDTVNRVVPQLIARGRYAPPQLGLTTDPRADALLRRNGLSGVMVLGVEPGSPAERAGIRPARIRPDGAIEPGDIVVAIDGREVENTEALRSALDRYDAGDRVTLRLRRGREQVSAELALEPGGG